MYFPDTSIVFFFYKDQYYTDMGINFQLISKVKFCISFKWTMECMLLYSTKMESKCHLLKTMNVFALLHKKRWSYFAFSISDNIFRAILFLCFREGRLWEWKTSHELHLFCMKRNTDSPVNISKQVFRCAV